MTVWRSSKMYMFLHVFMSLFTKLSSFQAIFSLYSVPCNSMKSLDKIFLQGYWNSVNVVAQLLLHDSLFVLHGGGASAPFGPPDIFVWLLANLHCSRREALDMTFFFQVSRIFWQRICDSYMYVCGFEVTLLFVHVLMSDRMWPQNVISCMLIEFFPMVHIDMCNFTLNGWNSFVLALLCCKKGLSQILLIKANLSKLLKKKIHNKFIKQ